MASSTLNATLLTRSDTEANFQTNNPILAAGEMAISTDKNNRFKVGDGVNTWSDLSYNSISWNDVIGKPSAATTAPADVSTTAATGSSTDYARKDHVHAITVATGDSNGQVKIAGQNANVKGLQNGAFLNQFVGTTAEWDLLTTDQKKAYDSAIFTDDYNEAAVGNLNTLTTTDKSSVVAAINEVNNTKQAKTDNGLTTTAKTVVGAINELKSGLTNVMNAFKQINIGANRTQDITVTNPCFFLISVTNEQYELAIGIGTNVKVLTGTVTDITITKPDTETLRVANSLGWAVNLWIFQIVW